MNPADRKSLACAFSAMLFVPLGGPAGAQVGVSVEPNAVAAAPGGAVRAVHPGAPGASVLDSGAVAGHFSLPGRLSSVAAPNVSAALAPGLAMAPAAIAPLAALSARISVVAAPATVPGATDRAPENDISAASQLDGAARLIASLGQAKGDGLKAAAALPFESGSGPTSLGNGESWGTAPAADVSRATPADLDGIMEIERRSFHAEEQFSRRDYQAAMVDPQGALLVIRAGGQVAAAIYYTIEPQHHRVYIASVATHPAHKHKGYAQALLGDAIQAAQQADPRVHSVTLHVRVDNAGAIRLYQKLGFRVLTTYRHYYHDGTGAHYMSLAIRPRPSRGAR